LLGGCGDDDKTVILIADAGNGRIVQMDDFSGAGWATFAYPRVNMTLIAPVAIAVDTKGRIYAPTRATTTSLGWTTSQATGS
jgi:hypothetical protein